MLEFLRRIRPEKIAADLLYEARRRVVEHEAAAEHHGALAAMYSARIARLETHPVIGGPGVAAGPVSEWPSVWPSAAPHDYTDPNRPPADWPPRRVWDDKAGAYRLATDEERAQMIAMQRPAAPDYTGANRNAAAYSAAAGAADEREYDPGFHSNPVNPTTPKDPK